MHSPEIFDYSDYRTYLKAHHAHMLQRQKQWSLGSWSKKLGFANTAVLANIINGRRSPGSRAISAFVEYFKLPPKQEAYFRNLVLLEKSKSNSSLHLLLCEKASQQNPKLSQQILDDKSFNAIASWHYYAIREMVRLQDFNADPDWIVKQLKFKLTKKQAKLALEQLLELGLLEKAERGRLRQNKRHISTTNEIASEAIKRYHEGSLELSQKSIRSLSVEERDLSSLSFCAHSKDIVKIKQAIASFRQQILSQFEAEETGDQVFQLNIQLLPLTIQKEGRRSS